MVKMLTAFRFQNSLWYQGNLLITLLSGFNLNVTTPNLPDEYSYLLSKPGHCIVLLKCLSTECWTINLHSNGLAIES